MKKLQQRTFDYNVELVRYENPQPRDAFDLTTVHSLLIDHNQKFVQLKQLVADYNKKQIAGQVNRPHLNRAFIERLYKMLCEVTRMYNMENQSQFLNKIHAWAFMQQPTSEKQQDDHESGKKLRPNTASTKTRPYSAYTNANVKKTRPDSAIPAKMSVNTNTTKNTAESEVISKKVMDRYQGVDFKQLKHGEREFFLGHRTLHPEQQKPKIKLKEYHRKVFYDEANDDDDFEEFVEEKFVQPAEKSKKQAVLPRIQIEEEAVEVNEKQKIDEIGQQQGEIKADGVEGGIEGAVPGEQDVNIDDLVGGEEEVIAEEEEVQIVDKLRPNIKVYGDELKSATYHDRKKMSAGIHTILVQKEKAARNANEDYKMKQVMNAWAATKSKVAMEHNKRAESARILTQSIGLPFAKFNDNEIKGQVNVVDFSEQVPTKTKTNLRPKTAFKAESKRAYEESIRDAIVSGHLSSHIKSEENNLAAGKVQGERQFKSLSAIAPKPKKKTFEDILREAEQRVTLQAQQQVNLLKQKLTINKISIGANKIAKSLTYHESQLLDEDFTGPITGGGMLNNPFFKVAKKKKKKKKKK